MTHADVYSPVNGSLFATVSVVTDHDADMIPVAARKAQEDWRAKSPESRIEHVKRLLDEMKAAIDLIAEKGLAPHLPAHATGSQRMIQRVPHGVCLVIAPLNDPYLTAMSAIIPALLAGNTVILKPAAQTALTAERLNAAFTASGLPAGVFKGALLTHETVARWIDRREVDFVSFTGSVRGGTQIESAAAGRFPPLTLELGEKDQAYVQDDADLDLAANELVYGSFNSGQSCCEIERIYVAKEIYRDFTECFTSVACNTQLLGDPTKASTTFGPMVSQNVANAVRGQIHAAVAAGASLASGDEVRNTTSPYVPASVVLDTRHDMVLMREEAFGHVVGIMPVDDDQHAIRMMNDSKHGLSASVWVRDLTWTGIKVAGRGCSLSELAYHHVTRPKSYYIH